MQTRHLRTMLLSAIYRHKRQAMNAWIATSVASRANLRLLRNSAASLRQKPMRQALNSWIKVASLRSGALKKLRTASASLRNSGLRKSMNVWMVQAWARSHALATLRASVQSLRHGGLRNGLNAWAEKAKHGCEVQRKMRAAASELMGGRLRAAWSSWREIMEERRSLRRVVKSFTSPGLRRAMTAWHETASGSRRSCDVLMRAMNSMRDVGRRRALNSWRALWRALEDDRKHKRLMAICASARMGSILLTRGLSVWHEWIQARRAVRRESCLVQVIAVRLLRSSAVRYGFQLWWQVCRQILKRAEAVRLQRASFCHRIRCSFYAWMRNGCHKKVGYVCAQFAQTQADLETARSAAQVLEGEAIELRRMLVEQNDGRRTNLVLEAEVSHLRTALAETRALNKQLEERAGHFDQQYRRLWRATHDPTYISSVQAEARLLFVPGSRGRVEKMQQRRQKEDEALGDFEPRSDDRLTIKPPPGELAVQCCRSSTTSVSTFSSRQMLRSASQV